MRYTVLYDQARDGSWGAVVPDLPGCCSAGDSLEHARENVKEAISLWLDAERESGHSIPRPNTIAETVEIA